MVVVKNHTITISKSKAEKKAVFIFKDTIYNEQKNELSFKVRHVSEKYFRLVFSGMIVWAIVEGTAKTITSTLHSVEEFTTKQRVLDRIDELGLECSIKEI